MNIHESAEDYLEAILILREQLGMVRSIDIVHHLDYTKPSVSVAMKRLRENGYIEMDGDGHITLLPPGEAIAQRIYDRHKLLTQLLVRLGVDPKTAAGRDRVVKKSEKDSLYAAMDIAAVWLDRSLNGK